MPEAFLKCIADGGRVRTKSLSDGRYIRICYKDGKSYAGGTHEKKGNRLKQAISGKGG